MDSSGSTLPAWLETCAPPSRATYPPLNTDLRCDVVIIGAGIAGLQVAYELSNRQSALSIVVIDDGAVASGETGRTTAHFTNAFDDHYYMVKKVLGEEAARQVAASHTWAIERVAEIIKCEAIDCDFARLNAHMIHGLPSDQPGYSDSELLKEYEAARSLGLPVYLCEQSSATPSFASGTTLIFEHQAQLQPLKYMTQLAERLVKRGVQIYCGTHAAQIHGGSAAHVKTSAGHTIRAAHIVEATNIPISNKLAIIDQCMPYRTYAVALYIPRGVGGEYALVYDMADPYHYVRRTPATEQLDLLIIGGEDHKVGDDTKEESLEARFERLEIWARQRWPEATRRAYCWSGQVTEPTDLVALIGRNAVDHDNVYVVTGDSGNGMTHGMIAGRVISELITGSDSEWAKLYNPRRFSHELSTMAKHNMHVGAQYLRWFQGSDVRDIEDLKPCHGAVLSCRLPVPSHVAVYKDDQGKLHRMSAVCPHAYGIVQWNPLEHSWDCPAHGSRFTPFGKVVNGPACNDLKPLPDKE